MRKISPGQIATFITILAIVLMLAAGTAWGTLGALPLGDFRGIAIVAAAAILVIVYGIAAYRLFLWLQPLPEGEIPHNSRAEFIYHVYLLFFLVLFYPLMRSGAVPVPILRLIYLALGARLGENTYSSGIILDPIFVEIGSNSIVGQFALLVPHVIEGEKLAHYPIRIGNNVTIGAHSCVLSGVTIGDGAIVATGAVVSKGTRIAPGEVWGGVPARRLQPQSQRDSSTAANS
ncbi:DapH/DapD/GlmU-related protein [Aromatoleum diolicum]|uniref:Acyltransferase n=1 Tax=Aromatoleum diolicum TaxID=75796 RepID=A0ABX1QFL4_9RHOO|nr:DapH/DapD/GlmU-related protein [Aromatoleum diolicum]NMG76287.1 acyltransferase [Aromatoleum diolicum]